MPKPSISPWPEHAFAERRRDADVLGRQPAETAFERKVSCGPPRGRGCGPHFVVSRRMDWLLFADGGRNATAVRRKGAAANCAVLKNRKNTHASACPAAETISEKGRTRRRSVKNRRLFDCFKSAEGIRFSEVARPTPKSVHRGGFSVTFCPNKR